MSKVQRRAGAWFFVALLYAGATRDPVLWTAAWSAGVVLVFLEVWDAST